MEENEFWDGNEEQLYDESPSEYTTSIRVNGSDRELQPGANFISTCKQVAREAGLGKFRILLNGEEVRPSEAPDVITEGMHLEARPYDVAGM